MSTLIVYGISAFLLSTALHALAWKLFPRLGLLDHPEKYGLTRSRLPYPTGIASVATFLVLFAATRGQLTMQEGGLIAGIGLLALTAVIDDLRGLPPSFRLFAQILIGFLLFATGSRIYTITNPMGGIIPLDTIDIHLPKLTAHSSQLTALGPLPLWSGIFTIAWIVLTTNAFNWFDGIPGQVSILSVIGALTLGLLALSGRVNQPEIALIAFLAAGTALGSVFFDLPFTVSLSNRPNRAVIGDTGAMFFGLLLGALSIYAGGKVATALLVFGVPLLDALFVIMRRLLHGTPLLAGNRDHLHHRLLRKGWSEWQVIALTVLLGTAFGITALFLSTFGKFLALLLLAGIVASLTWYSRPHHGI